MTETTQTHGDERTDPERIIARSVRADREAYERLAACGGRDAYLYRLALAFNDGREPNSEDVRQFRERTESFGSVLTASVTDPRTERLRSVVSAALRAQATDSE